ncbi:MAG: M48 family metallopeptidase [Candidatus Kuenenbacteria bacterium]
MTKNKVIAILILSLISLSGCATVYNPATERKEFHFFDTKDEIELGNHLAGEVEHKYSLYHNSRSSLRIDAIGQKLAKVCDRQDMPYEFKVVDSDELNAFTIVGGKVYITRAIIDFCSSDDELAGILAHEIGHNVARHQVKALEAQLGFGLLSSLIFSDGKKQNAVRIVNTVYNLINLGYSRGDEFLADRLAVEYTYKAGYDPKAFIGFFEKLKRKKGELLGYLAFLNSHPPFSQRIEAIRKEIDLLGKEK